MPENLASDRADAAEGPLPVPLTSMLLAEAMGTFVLVQLGTAAQAVHVYIVSHKATSTGTSVFSALVWGAALTLAIYLCAAVSGAHLNPAVSLSFALVRPHQFRIQKVGSYCAAQVVGAAMGAMVTLFFFHKAIARFEHTYGVVRGSEASVASAAAFEDFYRYKKVHKESASSILSRINFVSHSHVLLLLLVYSLHNKVITNNVHAGFIEAFGTGMLCFVIFVCTHHKVPIPGLLVPALVGLTYAVLIYCLGPLTGGGFNPARELGPRILTSIVGWGWQLSFIGMWPYIVGPLVGGPVGAFLADRVLLTM